MEKQEDRICVLESYLDGFIVYKFALNRYDVYYDFDSRLFDSCGSKAEAILKYDLSGRAEPLYDNTGNRKSWTYSPDETRNMKRIK